MGSEETAEEKEKETPFSKMMGAWTGFLIVTVIMILLFRAAWWIIFPIIGSFSGAVKETQKFLASKVKCPNCGAALAVGTPFCGQCGVTLPKECLQCHKPIKAGLKYCAECGAPLFSSPNITSASITPQNLYSQDLEASPIYCKSCGSEISLGQNKCPTCGASKN